MLINSKSIKTAGLHWCREITIYRPFYGLWNNFCTFFSIMGESSIQKFPRYKYNPIVMNGVTYGNSITCLDDCYQRPTYRDLCWTPIIRFTVWGKHPFLHFKDHVWLRPFIVFNWRKK